MLIPEGYKLRPIQEKTINEINSKDNKFFILNLPTGSGKSLISETIAINNPSTVITKTKFLQEQYLKEFNYDNLKGKNNYTCDSGYVWQSEECITNIVLTKKECYKNCPYQIAKKKFIESNKRLTNFAYLLSSPWLDKYPTKFLIIDEAHNFGSEIINALTIKLNFEDLVDKFGNDVFPVSGLYINNILENLKEEISKLENAKRNNLKSKLELLRNGILSGYGTMD
jgi:Rad3-related DNA helicase